VCTIHIPPGQLVGFTAHRREGSVGFSGRAGVSLLSRLLPEIKMSVVPTVHSAPRKPTKQLSGGSRDDEMVEVGQPVGQRPTRAGSLKAAGQLRLIARF
jgi:hypothetical protein